ncbi:MAG: ubiquinone/menaquinone biosynthesis methyltransferase [Candidatus Marsarchaeota archaeon]|nr:ubiquinone/menaquinone biosynthesis methyltransferase [Candidatus Marsarchaeota archaeon]
MSDKINSMFSSISSNYDKLNRIISLGLDKKWRRKSASKCLDMQGELKILDVATGTGELAIEISKLAAHNKKIVDIIGVDFNADMLAIAENKIKKLNLQNIKLINEDILSTNFDNKSFNIITSAFALRNLDNLDQFIDEINRLLKDNGKIIFLDVSKPGYIFSKLFKFYYFYIIPLLGSKYNKNAYYYLVMSLWVFDKNKFIKLLENKGFINIKLENTIFNTAFIVSAEKPTDVEGK